MNFDELNAEMGRNKLTIPKLAEIVGIGKKAMYERFRGETQFRQKEIVAIKQALSLSDERVIEIFLLSKLLKRNQNYKI